MVYKLIKKKWDVFNIKQYLLTDRLKLASNMLVLVCHLYGLVTRICWCIRVKIILSIKKYWKPKKFEGQTKLVTKTYLLAEGGADNAAAWAAYYQYYAQYGQQQGQPQQQQQPAQPPQQQPQPGGQPQQPGFNNAAPQQCK